MGVVCQKQKPLSECKAIDSRWVDSYKLKNAERIAKSRLQGFKDPRDPSLLETFAGTEKVLLKKCWCLLSPKDGRWGHLHSSTAFLPTEDRVWIRLPKPKIESGLDWLNQR
eukprot:GHVR01160515.1.p1 GENE.GHVR01160515.1~~GHVR01160515.1.p1  ORF type:complete len:111 (+),score=8.71 GHVR01160515.1:472-804(+)